MGRTVEAGRAIEFRRIDRRTLAIGDEGAPLALLQICQGRTLRRRLATHETVGDGDHYDGLRMATEAPNSNATYAHHAATVYSNIPVVIRASALQ